MHVHEFESGWLTPSKQANYHGTSTTCVHSLVSPSHGMSGMARPASLLASFLQCFSALVVFYCPSYLSFVARASSRNGARRLQLAEV